MPRSEVERRAAILCLKIDITARSKELLRHSWKPSSGRLVESRARIVALKIDVTARCQELLRNGLMPFFGREVERRAPMRVLVVDEGLRALCRQQFANLRCVAITRGIAKVLTRHSFHAP
jgi:hypothetical protein